MITVQMHQQGATRPVDRVDPDWLKPGSGVWVWVDLSAPTPEDARILSDVFHFHELAIEDALSEIHHPKVESFGNYLYLILHGINFRESDLCFSTQDVDFFLGEQFLVTVHPGISRSLAEMREVCSRNDRALGEGPAALLHRIVDTMVDHYRPEVDRLGERLDKLETEIFERPDARLARQILDFKADVSSLRRIVLPQRDLVGRLARREFPLISEPIAYRFRDVYDNLVRLVDEAMFFQDRVTSLLDAHLSQVSNQLNNVMKVLTIIATVFMPLTFITGLYGMNVPLPHFGLGEDNFFWGLFAVMLLTSGLMLAIFRRRGWLYMTVALDPIGIVRSAYQDTASIPKGLGARHDAEGVLEIRPELEPGLQDIEGFSHLYVIWIFDRTEGADLIAHPPSDDRPHGVFATRSPQRPNPIGLTVVELLRREGHRLHVRGIDMLDGTPIVDIKPYLSGVPAEQLRRGWLDEAEARRRRT